MLGQLQKDEDADIKRYDRLEEYLALYVPLLSLAPFP